MHDSTNVPLQSESTMQRDIETQQMTGAKLARRHALLVGLGRGSAIVAAVTPIKTLAGTQSVTANGKLCTVSGVGSAVHSSTTIVTTCGGLSPGWYKTPDHWPYYSSYVNNNVTKYKSTFSVIKPSGGSVTVTVKFTVTNNNGSTPGGANDTAFSAIFGGGSSNGIFYILKNQASSDEFHWIAALLNAVFFAGGGWPQSPKVYPYTPTEILNLYTTNYEAGLAFIKGYMETL